MSHSGIARWVMISAAAAVLIGTGPVAAQTSLTLSSWVPATHSVTKTLVA